MISINDSISKKTHLFQEFLLQILVCLIYCLYSGLFSSTNQEFVTLFLATNVCTKNKDKKQLNKETKLIILMKCKALLM